MQRAHAGLLVRLREETSREHAALEASVPLLSETVSRADYVRFLTLIGAFHATVEQRVTLVDGLASVVADLPERRKAALIARDLAALGVDAAAFSAGPASLGRCPHEPESRAVVPSIASIDRALGILYVLEGSTLGGQHLHRHLSVSLPEVTASASHFLTCYGPKTGQMWRTFRQHVERAAPELDAEVVIDAAREAFAVLLDWFRPTAAGAVTERVA
ncbi:MAG TPA: biliverdin-producing heme oxygenase [Polyangiaceae bacterium]|nr:biliverdin-producing heme oxygenase [Polyangiaceae bacterium]